MNFYKTITISLLTLTLFACKGKKDIAKNDDKNVVKENTTITVRSGTPTPTVILDVVEGLNLGNKAPDFKQAGIDGKDISLSSTKGKVILIDFWASWCGPCRKENPAVVAAYNKYKTSLFKNGINFEILSVSLDQNKDAWIKAIDKDNLIWKNHVCDFLGWSNTVAQLYQVNGIPTNYLINGDGIIIGKGLRGEDLEKSLQIYLK